MKNHLNPAKVSRGLVVFIIVLMGCREAIYVDESTIDFPIFLLFFNTKFPIFSIFSILSFLFSYCSRYSSGPEEG